MDAFVFQAALLCEECGEKTRDEITEAGNAPADSDDETSYDSDDYPKGPYADGGGEADSPQHCDHCKTFDCVAFNDWAPFYDLPTDDIARLT